MLSKHKSFTSKPTDAAIILICVCKNEQLIIPHFIEHYNALGVTHFIFIDNDSTDDTVEIILKSPANVMVYQTSDSFSGSVHGSEWVREVMSNYKDQWLLLADCDELLSITQPTLHDLRSEMTRTGCNVVDALFVDMYPRQIHNVYMGGNYNDHSNYYDSYRTYNKIPWPTGTDNYTGGVRPRVFDFTKIVPPCMVKKPFFRYDFYKTHQIYSASSPHWIVPHDFEQQHWSAPAQYWNEHNKHLKYYPELVLLRHYKFLKPNLEHHYQVIIEENQHYANCIEYKQYSSTLAQNKNNSLFYNKDISVKFNVNTFYNDFFNK